MLRKKRWPEYHFRPRNDLIVFLITYMVSVIFLLLNYDALYWDDWLMAYQTPNVILKGGDEMGNPFFAFLYTVFIRTGNIILTYRILGILLFYLTAVFIYFSLRKIKELTKSEVFFIVLFYLIFPVNFARASIACNPFIIPVFIFYGATYLLTLYLDNERLWCRILLLILFMISFFTNSLLVYYILPLGYIYYAKYSGNSIKWSVSVVKFLKGYPDFIILPFVFFLMKSLLWTPHGEFETYNSITPVKLLLSVFTIPHYFYSTFIHPAFTSISFATIIATAIICAVSGIHCAMHATLSRRDVIFLLIGALLFTAAVFPYCAVGKIINNSIWTSRYQLLTPLGSAIMLVFLIRIIAEYFNTGSKALALILGIFITSFTLRNIKEFYDLNVDWFYQVSIMENMKDNEMIRENKTFIAENNIRQFLSGGRNICFYEWTGMLKETFKEETRMIVDQSEKIEDIRQIKNKYFNKCSNWIFSEPLTLVINENPQYTLNEKNILKLFFYRMFNYAEFKKNAKSLTMIMVKQ